MANRYNGDIITIDTTDTQVGGNLAASQPKGSLHILAMKWVGSQNSGKDIAQTDDLTIKIGTSNGDEIIAVRAQASTPHQVAYSVDFGRPWIVSGLYIEDIDGGELQIFLG